MYINAQNEKLLDGITRYYFTQQSIRATAHSVISMQFNSVIVTRAELI
jgi:hypothetical protein